MKHTYITVKLPTMYHQMSIEELFYSEDPIPSVINANGTSTRTYKVEHIPLKISKKTNVGALVRELAQFNERYAYLVEGDRRRLYRSFVIPKKTGGLRHIDAPNDELMSALRELKRIFEVKFGALYHTGAYAYIENRSTVDAVKKHQMNNSKWFAKYDLSNFFGSTTIDFVMQQLSMIYPFSEVCANVAGKVVLRQAVELAFLDGALPQGTPISPMITNIMMIPLDYRLNNELRHRKERLVYTRYADDFIISSRYPFDHNDIEQLIEHVIDEFHAPFHINQKKTRYGSNYGSGANWNLGLMLNKNNDITIGRVKKRHFQNALVNYARDKKQKINWQVEDLQVLIGQYRYYRMVEKENIDHLVDHISKKEQMDVIGSIILDITGCCEQSTKKF